MFGKAWRYSAAICFFVSLVMLFSCSDSGTGDDEDDTPPSVISDLAIVDFTSSSVTLSWTAPGDDGMTGQASYYDLRYSGQYLYVGTWESATSVTGEPTPHAAGTVETMTVTGLLKDSLYYFAVMALDEADNSEGPSNCISVTCFDDSVVTFADANLEAAVRTQVSKVSGDILLSDILAHNGLEAGGMDIVDLSGIEAWNTLIIVGLEENQISDLTPLAGLTSLTGINLWDNEIEDLSPLAGLDNLTHLSLHNNDIVDISDLSVLTALQSLHLGDNLVSDIAPLVLNSGLGSGDEIWLTGNPLSYESINTHIPALRDRDVDVYVNEDIYAPAAIDDLTVTQISDTSITIIWTATGDDIQTGTAWGYDIRYSSDSSVLAGWDGAETVDSNPVPQISGSSESFEVTGLDVGTTYFIGIKAYDEWDNHSELSNIVKATPFIDEIISFPDAGLDGAIRYVLNKPAGDIYRTELLALTVLDADSLNISNLSGLEYCENLTTLRLSVNNISDISALAGLINLIDLEIAENQISDITPLGWLTDMWDLDIGHNLISDISALSGMTQMMYLDIESNNISDISPLSGMLDMWSLQIAGNPITDIGPLSSMTNLNFLSMMSCQVSDLSPLSGMNGLQYLIAVFNQISDLSPLAGKANLTIVYLNYNDITDVTALQGATAIQRLYLDFNSIVDISPLVANAGLGSGDELDLEGNPLSVESINTHIPTLEARGVTVVF